MPSQQGPVERRKASDPPSAHLSSEQDAIRSFNKARGDPEWGLEATYQMVEIFLDPNSDQLWAAVGDDEDALPENFQVMEGQAVR